MGEYALLARVRQAEESADLDYALVPIDESVILCGYVNERLAELLRDSALTVRPCDRPLGHLGFHFHEAV